MTDIRVDAKTGETFERGGKGESDERLIAPAGAAFISEKKVPATGLRSDIAERVRRKNEHLPNNS